MDKKQAIVWAAGYFDGEGCVHISGRTVYIKGERRQHHALQLAIYSTNPASLRFLATHFGGKVNGPYNKGVGLLGPHLSQWGWSLCGKTALPFLRSILPYLLIKAEEVALALQFPYNSEWVGKNRQVPVLIVNERQALREELSRLKRREYLS